MSSGWNLLLLWWTGIVKISVFILFCQADEIYRQNVATLAFKQNGPLVPQILPSQAGNSKPLALHKRSHCPFMRFNKRRVTLQSAVPARCEKRKHKEHRIQQN